MLYFFATHAETVALARCNGTPSTLQRCAIHAETVAENHMH